MYPLMYLLMYMSVSNLGLSPQLESSAQAIESQAQNIFNKLSLIHYFCKFNDAYKSYIYTYIHIYIYTYIYIQVYIYMTCTCIRTYVATTTYAVT